MHEHWQVVSIVDCLTLCIPQPVRNTLINCKSDTYRKCILRHERRTSYVDVVMEDKLGTAYQTYDESHPSGCIATRTTVKRLHAFCDTSTKVRDPTFLLLKLRYKAWALK